MQKLMLTLFIVLNGFVGTPTSHAQLFNPDAEVRQDINPKEVIIWQLVQIMRDSNGIVEAGFTLRTLDDFTIYEDKLKVTPPPGYVMIDTKVPATKQQFDPISAKEVPVYTAGEFYFYFKPNQNDAASEASLSLSLTYTGCTQVICLFPFTEEFSGQVYKAETPLSYNPSIAPMTEKGPKLTTRPDPDDISWTDSFSQKLASGTLSLSLTLLIVFLGGILTNLTPCVYPMIPITLRLLGGQKDRVLLNSTFYALGILVTYTSLGIFAASTGSMFGAVLQNKTVNVVFAIFMLLLGLSMLGFGNYSKLQEIGDRLGAGKPSLKNMFLMGVGAGFVASPCTGPVMGALLTLTLDTGDIQQGVLLLFTYSLGFSLPYIFLGGAAAKVSKVRLAPRWQVLTKIVFSAVMFALVLYYLRIPLYDTFKSIKPYWQEVLLYSGSASLLLLAIWATSLRLLNEKYLSIVPALVTGVAVFALSQHLTSSAAGPYRLPWHSEEASGFRIALEQNKPILVDGWAEWCEACKTMEATTFQDPDLVEELTTHWVLIKLDLTEDNDENDELINKYGMPGLPTMVLLPSDADLSRKVKIVGEKSADYFLKRLQDYRKEL